MDKRILFKVLKSFAYCLGFPLLSVALFIMMMPQFNTEVLGYYARNWMLVTLALWAVVEIVRFLLNRFVGSKSCGKHKLVLVVMAVFSILVVLLPPVLFDAVHKKNYETTQASLKEQGVGVKNFNNVMGWHRGFTKKSDSETYVLVNKNYDFMQMYGLEHVYSEWYDNADRENNLGYKYGTFEKVKKLIETKSLAVEKLAVANAELAAVMQPVYVAQAALYVATIEYDKAVADNASNQAEKLDAKTEAEKNLASVTTATEMSNIKALVRLKGQRIDLTATIAGKKLKDTLVDLVFVLIGDIANANGSKVFPDGLNINLIGIDIPVVEILKELWPLLGSFITKEMVMGLIPDVIWTGIGDESIATYQKQINGSDTDMSLVETKQFDFELFWYPQLLAAGHVKFISFICVGLIVLSIFATDYFARLEKKAGKKKDEEVTTDGGAL